MGKTVQLLIKTSNKVVLMNEENARRFAKASPATYQILEPPTIEVKTIPPVEEKKSATPAEQGKTTKP